MFKETYTPHSLVIALQSVEYDVQEKDGTRFPSRSQTQIGRATRIPCIYDFESRTIPAGVCIYCKIMKRIKSTNEQRQFCSFLTDHHQHVQLVAGASKLT